MSASHLIVVNCDDCDWSLGTVRATGRILHLIVEHEETHGHTVSEVNA